MFDPSKYSDEQLLAEYQRAKGGQQTQIAPAATRPKGTLITDLLDKINPKLTNSLIGAAEGFTGKTISGTTERAVQDPYTTEYAKQAAMAQFPGASKPTPEQELEQFKAKETFKASLKPQPLTEEQIPEGFVLVGGKPMADPNYVSQTEQLKLDEAEAERQAALESKRAKESLAKLQAQDIYNTAGEIEKGAGFFGMMGDAPSWAAPSTYIPGGKTYGDRANWEANIDKLRAGLTLENINTLRNAGSTGSTGMGVLSDKDINLLTNAATALRRNLEPKDALKYIKDIKDVQAKLLGMKTGGGSDQNNDPLGIFS